MMQTLQNSFSSSNGYNGIDFGQQSFGVGELMKMAKDTGFGNRDLQHRMGQSENFRRDVLQLVVNGGGDLLQQLCTDSNAHYIVKVCSDLKLKIKTKTR